MTLDNLSVFELMTAGAHASPAMLAVASALADWAVWCLPLAAGIMWLRGDRGLRRDLGRVLAALASACGLLLAIRLLGALACARIDAGGLAACWQLRGLPNGQMLAWWSVALSLLPLGRISWLAFPLLTAGLGVGWSLVYLGRAFPLEVLGALPVAAAGALVAAALRRRGEAAARHGLDS